MIKLCSVVCLNIFNSFYSASQTRTCTKVKIKLTTKSCQKLCADDFWLKENHEMQWVDGSTFEVRIPAQTWSLNCQVLNTYEHAPRTSNVKKHPRLAFHVHNNTPLFKLAIVEVLASTTFTLKFSHFSGKSTKRVHRTRRLRNRPSLQFILGNPHECQLLNFKPISTINGP